MAFTNIFTLVPNIRNVRWKSIGSGLERDGQRFRCPILSDFGEVSIPWTPDIEYRGYSFKQTNVNITNLVKMQPR